MDGYVQLDEISRDILKEIGNVGTGNAVTSLSQMMEQPIELDMPSLSTIRCMNSWNSRRNCRQAF